MKYRLHIVLKASCMPGNGRDEFVEEMPSEYTIPDIDQLISNLSSTNRNLIALRDRFIIPMRSISYFWIEEVTDKGESK